MNFSSTRRAFLQKSLAGSAVLPLALSFPSVLRASEKPAKRVIFIHMPDGINPTEWHPSNDLKLGAQNSALESVKQHCTFLRGVNLYNNPSTGASGTNHDGGTKNLFTNFATTSMNVAIGDFTKLQDAKLTHSTLLLGVRHNYQNFAYSTSYRNSNLLLPQDSPMAAYSSLFGEVGSGSNDSSVDIATQRRLDALANMQNELTLIQNQMGLIEKEKIDNNLDAISDLRNRINSNINQNQNTGSLSAENIVDIGKLQSLGSYTDLDNIPDVSSLQIDIAVAAIALGKTRSVTLNWSHNTSEMAMPWIGSNTQGHAASHAYDANFNLQRNWYAGEFARLINKLKSIPEGDGTLLDSTVIMLGSDVSHSNNHGGDDMPFIVAGGSSDISGGRVLSYNTSNEQLLVSLGQYAGMDLQQYGHHFGQSGGLANLITTI
jgi:hypothetical protein